MTPAAIRRLCLPSLACLLAAQPAPPPSARPSTPELRLVLLAPGPTGSGSPLSQDGLLMAEGLDHLYWDDLRSNAQVAAALRKRLALPAQVCWVLTEGEVLLASGTQHLDADATRAQLEALGRPSPLTQLRTFLKRRPDHLEARQKLLHGLRTQAEARTRRILGDAALAAPLPQAPALQDLLPRPGVLLKPENDLRIWGETYRELQQAYQNGDWLALSLPPDLGLGPFSRPRVRAFPLEAASPLMRGLFQRQWPKLLATLQETPGDDNVRSHALWVAVILGQPLAPVFDGLLQPFHTQNWPGNAVRQALIREARALGHWPRLATELLAQWSALEASRWNTRGTPQEQAYHERQWQSLGLPAVDASLRAGQPDRVLPLLEELASTVLQARPLQEAAALARTLKRPDVARDWLQIPTVPPLPAPCRTTATLVTTAANPAPLQDYDWSPRPIPVYSLHPDAKEGRSDAAAWRRYLRWAPTDARWAILDSCGTVVLEGLEPMDAVATQRALKAWIDDPGKPMKPRPAQTEAVDAPWSKLIRLRSDLHRLLAGFQPGGSAPSTAQTRSRRVEEAVPKARALREILDQGLWRRAGWPEVSVTHGLLVPELAQEATPWLEALEAELVRRPHALPLWALWHVWVGFTPERSLSAFTARLERDPLVGPETEWPPMPLYLAMKIRAMPGGDWRSLQQLVAPLWEGARQQGDPDRDAWFNLGLPLAASLLGQGLPQAADQLLVEAGAVAGDRKAAAALALQREFPALAAHWDPQATRQGTPR